ncbi:MAG: ankyrin repeat domain-containing protein, partial [Rickettsiales bacterium]
MALTVNINAEIVAKIDPAGSIVLKDDEDPIVWAINNNKRIEGKDPIMWAINNNKRIEGKDPIMWAINNNKLIEGKDPVTWAIDNDQKIDGQQPAAWAYDNKLDFNGRYRLAYFERSVRDETYAVKAEESTLPQPGELQRKGAKTIGISTGMLVQRDGITYIAKEFMIELADAITTEQVSERDDGITELYMGGIYEKGFSDNFGQGQGPKVRLMVAPGQVQNLIGDRVKVLGKDGSRKVAHVTSRFFEGFRPFYDLDKSEVGTIKGFEAVIAAIIIMGETDYHGNNTGVVKRGNELLMVKIDHGRSSHSFASEKEIRRDIQSKFALYGYNAIPFDIVKFKAAIDKMVEVLKNDLNLEDRLNRTESDLRKIGCDLAKDLTAKYHYERIQKNLVAAKELSQALGVIALFKNLDLGKNAQWLETLGGLDVFKWAEINNYTIIIEDLDDSDKKKLLEYAIICGNKNMISKVKNEALVQALYDDNPTTSLHLAAGLGDLARVRQHLGGETKINAVGNNYMTALHYAAQNGNKEVVVLLLAVQGVEINAKDGEGKTALHYAAQNGNEEVVVLLLAVQGVEINLKDNKGKTALSYAVEIGNRSMIEFLLGNGADINV